MGRWVCPPGHTPPPPQRQACCPWAPARAGGSEHTEAEQGLQALPPRWRPDGLTRGGQMEQVALGQPDSLTGFYNIPHVQFMLRNVCDAATRPQRPLRSCQQRCGRGGPFPGAARPSLPFPPAPAQRATVTAMWLSLGFGSAGSSGAPTPAGPRSTPPTPPQPGLLQTCRPRAPLGPRSTQLAAGWGPLSARTGKNLPGRLPSLTPRSCRSGKGPLTPEQAPRDRPTACWPHLASSSPQMSASCWVSAVVSKVLRP